MALQTGGFSLSALPSTPQVPDNIGRLPIDPNLVLALTQQKLSAQRQQQELEMQQRAQAQQLSQSAQTFNTAAPVRALTAAQATAQGGLLPLQTSLAAAQTARQASQVGPEVTTGGYTRNPDGTYTLTNSVTKNGVLDSSSTNVSPFIGTPTTEQKNIAMLPPEQQQKAREMAAGITPKAVANQFIRYKTGDGSEHVGIIDRVTGKLRDATADDLAEENAGVSVPAPVGPTLQQQGAAKATAAAATAAAQAPYKVSVAHDIQVAKSQPIAVKEAAQGLAAAHDSAAQIDNVGAAVENMQKSSLGSGPVSGASPGARAIFGDSSAQQLDGAVKQAIATLIAPFRGAGRLTGNEFKQALGAMPETMDTAETQRSKMVYLKQVQQVKASRAEAYMKNLLNGVAPAEAEANAIMSIPAPDGSSFRSTYQNLPEYQNPANGIYQPQPAAPAGQSGQPHPALTPADADKLRAALQANPNDPRAPQIRSALGLTP